MATTPRLRVESQKNVRVVRFLDRRLFDERTVREVSDQLLLVLAEMGPGQSMVLDFTGVDVASSMMLARLVLLLRRIESLGGGLRLCELNESLESALKSAHLDRILAIDRDLRSALEHIKPGAT